MLNKYSIGLIVLVSALASLMQVNALICYKAANLTAGIVDVDQDHGTCTPNNFDLCADLGVEKNKTLFSYIEKIVTFN